MLFVAAILFFLFSVRIILTAHFLVFYRVIIGEIKGNSALKGKQTSNFYFIRQLTLIIFSLFVIQPGFAASVSKLYESSVKVDSPKGEQQQSENQLIAAAFTQVLIKVSGRSDVAASTGYSAMLKKAEGAISQFRYDYKVLSEADNETSQQGEQQEEKEKWFWVRFNAKTINALLKDAQIPIWGKIRPETLVWFSQETQGKRYLLSQYEEPEIYDVFKEQADKRGISLIFPFLDLQDQSGVSASDIWGNFHDAVLLASRRYQAQSTLTSRLFKEPSGLWVSQWNLLMLGEVQSWEIRDENLERVLASGIDELADKLSRQFTQVYREADDSSVLVQINNVGGFKDFQALDDYLRNLATVKSLAVMQVDQDKVIYSINYLSSKNSLIQEIRLGDLLNSVERSRVNHEQHNSSAYNSYKPVILGDLGANSAAASDREKALNTLDDSLTEPLKQASDGNTQTAPEAQVQEKRVEQLLPELEYWLAR